MFTKEDISRLPHIEELDRGGELVGIEEMKIEEKDIKQVIGRMKDNKTGGVDAFNSHFLKMVGDSMVGPLFHLFNSSMQSGEVPEDWRRANVTALHKKGSKKDPGNYRPVSLTSHVGKLMELIIKEKIVSYLEENNLLRNRAR